MNRILVLSLFTAVAVFTSSCKNDKVPSTTSDSTAGIAASDTARLAPAAPSDSIAAAAAAAPSDPVATATVNISTSMGEITAELYGKDAPKAVENFLGLAKKKYFDGIAFHRCIPGFVIQGGDPNSRDLANRSAWGTGGESIFGKAFEDELNPETPSYKRGYVDGTLAMANSGPNTNSSQFFIITGPQGNALPHSYTIFGKVTKGMDVVLKIEKTGAAGEIPQNPAVMKKVTVGATPKHADNSDLDDATSVTAATAAPTSGGTSGIGRK